MFINDGSTYATTEVLDTLAAQAQVPIHAIHFKRNQGKAEALNTGFENAAGDIVITLDTEIHLNHITSRGMQIHRPLLLELSYGRL